MGSVGKTLGLDMLRAGIEGDALSQAAGRLRLVQRNREPLKLVHSIGEQVLKWSKLCTREPDLKREENLSWIGDRLNQLLESFQREVDGKRAFPRCR